MAARLGILDGLSVKKRGKGTRAMPSRLSPPRRPWDRGIYEYIEKATFGVAPNSQLSHPSEESARPEENNFWHAKIIELKSPILTTRDLTEVHVFDNIRLYPPFELNRRSADVAQFREATIPDPQHGKCVPKQIIASPAIGFEESTALCYGLRIDYKPRSDLWPQLDYIKAIIRERSRQWWVAAARNPFDIGGKFTCDVSTNFSITDPNIHDGEIVGSCPWRPTQATQRPLGIEVVVDPEEWNGIYGAVSRKQPLEWATLFYLDGIENYMSRKNEEAIIKLCMSLEIMESKARALNGRRLKGYGFDLIRDASLWRDADRTILKRLFIDRNHIAHGKRPFNMDRHPDGIHEYLELTKSYYERFLGLCNGRDWHDIAALQR